MKITQEELDSLSSSTITKNDYDNLMRKISVVFGNLVVTLKPSLLGRGWFDFDTCDKDSEDSDGKFDPIRYKDNIRIYGEACELRNPYGYEFPTRWLTVEPEEANKEYREMTDGFRQKEEINKRKKEEEKLKKSQERLKIIESIKSKLTQEELRYVSFGK